jgi:hypothetical protein
MTICHKEEMKRAKHIRQTPDEPQTPTPESRYHVAHYGKSRNFAAYEGQSIIAVTLYRKGAVEITARLEDRDRRIATLESQLADLQRQTTAPPALSSTEPVKAQAWAPPQQLALIAAEDMPAYRSTSPRRRPAPAPRRS